MRPTPRKTWLRQPPNRDSHRGQNSLPLSNPSITSHQGVNGSRIKGCRPQCLNTLHSCSTLGWDMQLPSGKFSKMFSLYRDIDRWELSLRLYQTPAPKRTGYELIHSNTPCRACTDMEWVGPPYPDHANLGPLVSHVRAKAYEECNFDPEIYDYCSTRPALTKNKQPRRLMTRASPCSSTHNISPFPPSRL